MKYVIAAVFDNYINAHLARGLLEQQNINCWLKDEMTVTVDPILTNAIGGIKLMVTEVQLERTQQILQATKQEFNDRYPCPQCGSTHIEYISTPRKVSNWLGTFVSAVLGVGSATPIDKVYHCFDCGYEFDTD